MTTAFILTGLAAVFVIGFLLGDRRGVKQCNAVLRDCQMELFKAIGEELPSRPNLDMDEDRPSAPTRH